MAWSAIPSRYLFFDREDRMLVMRHLRALRPRLRAYAYDLVHIQTPFVAHYAGLNYARALGVPAVASYHTFFEEYPEHYLPWLPGGLLRRVARSLSRRQCHQVDAVVVPSRAMREQLKGYGIRVRMEVIPTGLDLERFQGGDDGRFRGQHGIAPERPVLVHVGRVAQEKNIDFLLHVLSRVRAAWSDVLLIVAGEGPVRDHLQQLAIRLGLADNTLFVGYLAREREQLEGYRAGDVFVFASRTETQGLVLLEAMALGVSVVSTAYMGTRDVVGPGRGALVARDYPNDFAAQVGRLLADPLLRAKLADDACAYAQSWSAAASARRMADPYCLLLPSSPAGRAADARTAS